jgi:hypothetical protein
MDIQVGAHIAVDEQILKQDLRSTERGCPFYLEITSFADCVISYSVRLVGKGSQDIIMVFANRMNSSYYWIITYLAKTAFI